MADENTVNKDIIYEMVVDALGLTLDGSEEMFKSDILSDINSCLGILQQAGCGKDIYADETTTWEEFFGASGSKGMAMNYVVTRTKYLFDPPVSSTLKAMQDHCLELLARINYNEGGEDSEDDSGTDGSPYVTQPQLEAALAATTEIQDPALDEYISKEGNV